ncbi:hypothetical protein [Flavobacterium xanthum]|uniref:Uncharacterized protein n=1 Tax=Flavobacterium xanthum TaxID=69322 RepID=A0A1M7J6F7_9FLAO|nr:hypothetical protein [Flavobacterium xanthum]SHM48555.1 hypothetical protein SAMN05443669_103927 [Flavobacterium xanthum]
MKKLFVLIAVLAICSSHSQSKIVNRRFTKFISQIEGDLNKDNIKDIVKVQKDPKNGDYKTAVFFETPDGKYKLICYNSSLLAYSDDRTEVENHPYLEINKEILILNYELLRGQHNYKFRYQKGSFEMIGYNSISSDGYGYLEKQDANLSTKIKIRTVEQCDVENIKPKVTTERLMINKLPIFQTFNPQTFNY